ncbi:hypothetical protein HGB25_03575 [Candidatus Saccharibacteria bacterium]|nr:hypothetical protein [Candidatus Saccharibacteria bacterium]
MIEIVFLIVQSVTLFASMPQIVKLFRLKQSDELSIFTWAIWLISQSVSLLYVLSINNIPLIAVNVAWVIFYVVMMILILKYKTSPQEATAESTVATG